MSDGEYFITMPRRCGKRFQIFKEIVDAVSAGKKVRVIKRFGEQKVYATKDDVVELMNEWFGKDGESDDV